MTPRRLPTGLLIFLAALALRITWVLISVSRDGATLHLPDERLHWELASNLVHRDVMVTNDGRYAARMPVYPLFLALFAPCGESGLVGARAVQALLGALAAWVVYAVADRAFGRRAALLAGALAALDLYAIFFANLLLTETLFTLFGLVMAAGVLGLVGGRVREAGAAPGASAVASAEPRPPYVAILCVGLGGALAVLTRPAALGWVVLSWLATIAFARIRGPALAAVALWAAMLLTPMVFWGLRNEALIGDYAWLSTNGGVTLYDAQGPQATGASDQSFLSQMSSWQGPGEAGFDRQLRAAAVEQMQRDPWRVVRLAGVKFLRTWSLTPNAEEFRNLWRDLASTVFTGAVLLGAAVGTWRLRHRPRLLLLLWLPVVYFTIVHCVYIGSVRYRVPLMPFVEILAAAAFAARSSRPATPTTT